jgi:hypothetical protein
MEKDQIANNESRAVDGGYQRLRVGGGLEREWQKGTEVQLDKED